MHKCPLNPASYHGWNHLIHHSEVALQPTRLLTNVSGQLWLYEGAHKNGDPAAIANPHTSCKTLVLQGLKRLQGIWLQFILDAQNVCMQSPFHQSFSKPACVSSMPTSMPTGTMSYEVN